MCTLKICIKCGKKSCFKYFTKKGAIFVQQTEGFLSKVGVRAHTLTFTPLSQTLSNFNHPTHPPTSQHTSTMVKLHIKRGDLSVFLVETVRQQKKVGRQNTILSEEPKGLLKDTCRDDTLRRQNRVSAVPPCFQAAASWSSPASSFLADTRVRLVVVGISRRKSL